MTRIIPTRWMRSAAATAVFALFSGCGGSSGAPPTPLYSIGGTVTGIEPGQSIVVHDNGGDDLTLSANGLFTFNTQIASGGAYAVTASPQKGVTCTVTAGSGTATADVNSVAVTCVTLFSYGVSISGLVGQGLTVDLQLAPTLQTLEISGNGEFVFPTPIPEGAYRMGIQLQPHSPTQRCVTQNAQSVIAGTSTINLGNVACGEFSYVTNAGAHTISVFSVDAATGALAPVGPPVATGSSPDAITSTGDKKYLYVANGLGNDVSAFAVDAVSGNLTELPESPFAAGTQPQAIVFYSALATRSCGYGPCHGRPNHVVWYLYVANTGSDSVSAYEVDQGTGVPTALSPASYATDGGPSAMAIDPSGQFLFTANSGGSNKVSAFLIDKSTGGLTPISGSPFSSGSSPSSLAFGALGKFLFAADAAGGTAAIDAFGVDPSTGALTALPGFPQPLPSCNFIVADQTGAFLYATTGTSLIGYSIDPLSGALTQLPGFPIAIGASADSVTIDPTNQFLYVRNGSAGTVTGFELNAATGALSAMPGSPFAVGKAADLVATF